MNLPIRSLALCLVLAAATPLAAQNQCITLQNGVDGYVSVPYSPSFVPTTGITVEAWVTYDETTLQTGYTYPTIARQDINAQSETWFFRINAGQTATRRLTFKVRTTNGQYDASWFFNPGQMLNWTHVAGTYDGTAVNVYVNGVMMASTPASGTLVDQQGALRIGKGDSAILPAGETWNGSIDELRIWPFARTAGEIAATMNAELVNVPGIVAVWSFNGTYGDSENGHNGTQSGSITFNPGVPGLSSLPLSGGFHFGAAQTGCHGTTTTSIGSVPHVGLQDFSVVGLGAPPGGAGILLVGYGALGSPITILGADVWVDLSAGFVVGVPGGTLGASRIPIPIPQDATIAGAQLFFQFAWLDTMCAAPLWSSDGLQVVVLP